MIARKVKLVYDYEINVPEGYEKVEYKGVDINSVLEDMNKSPSKQ